MGARSPVAAADRTSTKVPLAVVPLEAVLDSAGQEAHMDHEEGEVHTMNTLFDSYRPAKPLACENAKACYYAGVTSVSRP